MKGIIFDFNGTLYWDSQLHYDAWIEYSKILRGTSFTKEEMRDKMFGHTNADIIEYAIGRKPSVEVVEKYANEKEISNNRWKLFAIDRIILNISRNNKENFKLAPGAAAFLDFLKENNIPMTIATMSEWDNVEFYIKEFKLAKWFDVDKIVYSNGKIPGKPAPDIFLIAAGKIGLNPKDCVVFEDAIAGINAAKAAGIGKIIAVDSIEPIEFYRDIDGLSGIITSFDEVDKSMFEIPSVI